MLNQAAYSCTHYVLWTHLHIFKPQFLQVRSLVEMLYYAAQFLDLEDCFVNCFCIVLLTTAITLNICSGVIMIKWIQHC